MKVELERQEGCKVSLKIELPPERPDEVYNELIEEFMGGVRLDGFRKGKVPRHIIRNRFSAELRQEVMSKLIPEALDKAIRQEELRPVERPTLDEVDWSEGKPLRITANFEVQPDIQLKEYTDLSVELEGSDYEIKDEQIEKQLEHLRQRSANYRTIEGRPAAKGDFAHISLRGEPRAEGSAPFRRDNVLVEVGAVEGFSMRLERAEPGEKLQFVVDHPDDYQDPALAGKTVDYEVDVHELKERILPELDDDFAKDKGQFDSLDDLRAEIRRQLEEDAKHHRRSDSVEKLIDLILKRNETFELPSVMLQQQMNGVENEMRRRIAESGFNPDHIGYDWKAFCEAERPAAERAVRRRLLINTLGERESVSVKTKDVQAEIAAIAAARKEDPKELRKAMLADGRYEILQSHMLERAVEDWLLAKNKIEGS
ncbi:MAG TPA: trigger factor [Acidobacteriota bacterium]|nr:trigger factor [Acidobacteriota bacterium]